MTQKQLGDAHFYSVIAVAEKKIEEMKLSGEKNVYRLILCVRDLKSAIHETEDSYNKLTTVLKEVGLSWDGEENMKIFVIVDDENQAQSIYRDRTNAENNADDYNADQKALQKQSHDAAYAVGKVAIPWSEELYTPILHVEEWETSD